MNEAFITQLRSKVKRGMDDAFRRGDNISPPGVGYRLVEVKDANGNLVITHKNTIEKAVEIDPEAAEWTQRGAEMIAYEGRSANEDRQLKRLTDRLAKLDDTHLDAVPALAVPERGRPTDRDGAPVPVWDSIHSSPGAAPSPTAGPAEAIVPLTYDRRAAARKAAKNRDGAA